MTDMAITQGRIKEHLGEGVYASYYSSGIIKLESGGDWIYLTRDVYDALVAYAKAQAKTTEPRSIRKDDYYLVTFACGTATLVLAYLAATAGGLWHAGGTFVFACLTALALWVSMQLH